MISKAGLIWGPTRRAFAAQHSPGFLAIVNEAKAKTREVSVQQTRDRLRANPKAVLIDVREETEWMSGHA
jgi:hypothetical protein